MPLYEYHCSICGEDVVILRSIRDRDDPPTCACGGPTRRAVSRQTGFSLRGGGWYRDGYQKVSGSPPTGVTQKR